MAENLGGVSLGQDGAQHRKISCYEPELYGLIMGQFLLLFTLPLGTFIHMYGSANPPGNCG